MATKRNSRNAYNDFFINLPDGRVIKAVFYRSSKGNHRWRLVSSNNEIVAASTEAFSSRQASEENFNLQVLIFSNVRDR